MKRSSDRFVPATVGGPGAKQINFMRRKILNSVGAGIGALAVQTPATEATAGQNAGQITVLYDALPIAHFLRNFLHFLVRYSPCATHSCTN